MDNYWNFGIGQNTEAHVHVVEISLFILTIQQNVSLFFSVVRAHLAEQHDLFGHTRPIGRRLTMARAVSLLFSPPWPTLPAV